MSRSGYSDDCDPWALIRWRGAVASSIRGRRGQAMLRELAAALDALPEKRLATDALVTEDDDFCALGALGRARGIPLDDVDPEDRAAIAAKFGIAEALAAEIMFENDDDWAVDDREAFSMIVCGPMRPFEQHKQLRWRINTAAPYNRWRKMRAWVASNLKESGK